MILAEARELLKTDPRQIDALVAEKVMGWEALPGGRQDDPGGWCTANEYTGWDCAGHRAFKPTTSWDAMREVIERMQNLGWVIEIVCDSWGDGPADCYVLMWLDRSEGREPVPDGIRRASLPEAVALAALLAVGAITP